MILYYSTSLHFFSESLLTFYTFNEDKTKGVFGEEQ